MGTLLGEEKLQGVHPDLVSFIRAFAAQSSRNWRITEGMRTDARQRELYAQGRDLAGNVVDKSKVVTNAKDATTSAHGRGAALDLCPVMVGGRFPSASDPAWDELGKFCSSWGGMNWGGNFTGLVDKPHVELSGWKALSMGAKVAVVSAGSTGLILLGVAGFLLWRWVQSNGGIA